MITRLIPAAIDVAIVIMIDDARAAAVIAVDLPANSVACGVRC